VPGSAFVVLLRVHLFFPDAGSLKAKRAELNRVKAWLRDRVGAAVAEVDGQDTWQRSVLAVSLVAGTLGGAQDCADGVERFLDSRFPQGVRVERRVASWTDLEAIG
jgi:uncharacterized protein YlxP (DUF503 family)